MYMWTEHLVENCPYCPHVGGVRIVEARDVSVEPSVATQRTK